MVKLFARIPEDAPIAEHPHPDDDGEKPPVFDWTGPFGPDCVCEKRKRPICPPGYPRDGGVKDNFCYKYAPAICTKDDDDDHGDHK